MQKENNFFFSFSSESKLTKGSKLLNYCRTCKKSCNKIWRIRKILVPLHPLSRQKHTWRDGRVVDYSSLENYRTERYRGFESLSLRTRWAIRKGCSSFCYVETGRLTPGREFFQSLRFVKAALPITNPSLSAQDEQSKRVAHLHFFLSRIFFLFFCVFFLHY